MPGGILHTQGGGQLHEFNKIDVEIIEDELGIPKFFSISPSEMLTPGTAHKVEANDYTAIEFGFNKTDFASYSLYWPNTTFPEVKVAVKFILKQAGTGSYVRIAAKIKARTTGEDSSTAFDAIQFEAVPITTTTIGEIFKATLTFNPNLFTAGDAVALHVGRDGANILGGGTNDDFQKPIQVIAVGLGVMS